MSRYLDVHLHGTLAGHIAPDDHGRLAFRFAPSYHRLHPRPLLGQAFEDHPDRPFAGKRPDDLPPFFQNLIPEATGELRPILASRLGVPPADDAALLLALGRDLPGAVVVKASPSGATPTASPGHDDTILPTDPTDLDDNPLRFSLAGVQLKFSVILAHDRITLPASGAYGDWIAKFASRRFSGLCENEYATMRWAARAGFDVPELRLMPPGATADDLAPTAPEDRSVLLIRRYDRTATGRVHQEDFAQVRNLAPAHKYDHLSYEQLTALVAAIISPDAALELLRRLVFMIASGNGDAHLKNWSLVYPDPHRAALSPLYDQVATVAWPDEVAPELALKLAGRKAFHALDRAALHELARRARLDAVAVDRGAVDRVAVDHVIDQTLATLAEAWDALRETPDDTWPAAHRRALLDHFQRTPLLAQSPLGARTR